MTMIYIYGFAGDPYVLRIENLCARNKREYEVKDLNDPELQKWFYDQGIGEAPAVFDGDVFVGSFNDIVHYVWMLQRLEQEGLK
jgi:glutaredoxin